MSRVHPAAMGPTTNASRDARHRRPCPGQKREGRPAVLIMTRQRVDPVSAGLIIGIGVAACSASARITQKETHMSRTHHPDREWTADVAATNNGSWYNNVHDGGMTAVTLFLLTAGRLGYIAVDHGSTVLRPHGAATVNKGSGISSGYGFMQLVDTAGLLEYIPADGDTTVPRPRDAENCTSESWYPDLNGAVVVMVVITLTQRPAGSLHLTPGQDSTAIPRPHVRKISATRRAQVGSSSGSPICLPYPARRHRSAQNTGRRQFAAAVTAPVDATKVSGHTVLAAIRHSCKQYRPAATSPAGAHERHLAAHGLTRFHSGN